MHRNTSRPIRLTSELLGASNGAAGSEERIEPGDLITEAAIPLWDLRAASAWSDPRALAA